MAPADESPPQVRLGPLHHDSIAGPIYTLVAHGVRRRPDHVRGLRAVVVLRFHEGYPRVRIAFAGDEVVVGDDLDPGAPAPDLLITGRMGDVNALIATPLTGGLPIPTNRHGRAALGRLADGRVEVEGPLRLARRVIMALTLEDDVRGR